MPTSFVLIGRALRHSNSGAISSIPDFIAAGAKLGRPEGEYMGDGGGVPGPLSRFYASTKRKKCAKALPGFRARLALAQH